MKQLEMLREIARLAGDDPIVIAGDLTDKAKIDPITLVGMIETMRESGDWHVLPGNHDANSLTGGRFNVEIFKHLGERFHYLDGPWDVADSWRIWCLPFASIEENASTIERWRSSLDSSKHHALLMHNAIVGCKVDGAWRATSGLQANKTCAGFSKVWSGHFHSHQRFGRCGMYFGAPMQHRFSDEGEDRGVWRLSLMADGTCKEEFIRLDLPRFFTVAPGETNSKAKPGDYLRVSAEVTSAEWETVRPKVDQALLEAQEAGLNASSKHVPKYQHEKRFDGSEVTDFSLSSLVRSYLQRPDVDLDESMRSEVLAMGSSIAEVATAGEKITTSSHVKFISMSIADLFPIGKANVKLSDAGLVFVGGRNEDSDGAENNGAGKTSLYKSLTWILYGKTVDGESGDRVIRKGASQGSGVVKLSVDGVLWTVKRIRVPGATKLSVYRADGDPVNAPKKELQDVINGLIGLDFQGFRSTVLYGRTDPSCFSAPSCSDADRKEILHSILGTKIFDTALYEAKRLCDERSLEIGTKERQISKLDGRIAENDPREDEAAARRWTADQASKLDSLSERLKKLAEASEVSIDVEAAAKRKAALRASCEAEEGKGKLITAAEREIKALRAELDGAQKACSRLESLCAETLALTKQHEHSRRMLDGDLCSLCSSSLKEGRALDQVQMLDAKIQEKKTQLAKLRSDLAVASERRSAIKLKIDKALSQAPKIDATKIKRWTREIAEIDGASALAKQAEENRTHAVARLHEEIEQKRRETNPHEARIERTKERRAALVQERKKLREEIEALARKLGAARFWVHGFGPSGIPSIVLDSCMGRLTDRTNHYLQILTDGDITGQISTQKTIGSGDVRDKIAMTWTIEGNEGVTPSDGQSTKIRVAVDLALMDLACDSASIDLLLFDEVLDGLDEEGTQRMLDLLSELRGRKRSIFVISHAHSMAEVFETGLLVVKHGKLSTVQEIKQ
jgi:DNA repair exonuclease SbcCD ATPase subunit